MAAYNFGHVFASEMFGMWMVIVIALGGVANHVLNPTTGKGMGYGFIAITFMAAFAFPIVGFGSVSAMLNPAAALSVVVAGLLGPGQFFTVVAGEMVGAILGAMTVYVLYMPQIHKAGAKVFKFSDIKLGKKARDVEMAPKEQVEQHVNPLRDLEDDDDPFLGIFVSRPACYNPVICFLTEFTATFIFLFLVNLLTARGQYLYQPSYGMYSNIVQPLLIGGIIGTMILCMGPTGFAGNPARDLGPRIAHWLLPIPKNPRVGSEWWYAWIPVIAPLCGGAAAGGLYRAWLTILKGMVVPDTNPFATNALGNSQVTANLTADEATNNTALAAPGAVGASTVEVAPPVSSP